MDTAIQPGDSLKDGRYEIEEFLGTGQEKKIYLARDRNLDCLVALDVFSSNNPVMPGGQTLNAWEARILGQLGDHPNIATVLDRWNEGQTAFMTTRYLSGGSLKDLIADSRKSGQRLPVDEVLRIRQKSRTGLPTSTTVVSCTWTCSPKTYDSTSGTRSTYLISTPHFRSTTPVSLICRIVRCPATWPPSCWRKRARTNAPTCTRSVRRSTRCARDIHPSQVPLPGFKLRTIQPHSRALTETIFPRTCRTWSSACWHPNHERRPASAAEVLARLESIRAGKSTPGSSTGDSQPFPRPDPAELQASAATEAADYDVGDVIDDRFQILEIIDQGGFSKVYRVSDELEGEERALKLFNNAAGYNAVRRELRALRKIRHPHVVEVFGASKTRAGEWYLITEFIHGERLDEFITETRCLRDREAVGVALDLLDALVAFHPDSARLGELDAKRGEGDLSEAEYQEWRELSEKGLVHRDIKPRNVILTRTGAKLLDFNIASRVGDEVRTVSGTPPYQPPDVDLTRWDVAPDLFAVGVVLYELLCNGHHPYPNRMPVVYEPVIDPRTIRPELNEELAQFLMKACAPDKPDRFSTAAEMQLALREVPTDL